jgi:hypothetical protein
MSESLYMLEKLQEDVLLVKLSGMLNQEAVDRLGHALEERWRELFGPRDAGSPERARDARPTKASAARPLVLIDMREVTGCDIAARTALIRVQSYLRTRAARTAYLADQPRLRGLALWVAHLAGDAGAKAVPTQSAADAWLGRTEGRVVDARIRMDALHGGHAPVTSGIAGAALRFAASVDRLRGGRSR